MQDSLYRSERKKELASIRKVVDKIPKFKGEWVKVPDYHHNTYIFVREGWDKEERIKRFLRERTYQENNIQHRSRLLTKDKKEEL